MCTSSNSLPKWQLALVVGAPVAIGLSYMYYKNKNSNNDRISDKREKTKQDTLASKSLSIDDNASAANKSQSQPNEAEIYKNEGNKQFKLGNYEEAILQYEKAIEICPENRNKEMAIFYQNKAAAYEQLKNYDAVKVDCTKALELDPNYTKALLRRTRASEKLGEFESALDDVTTACVFENFAVPTTLTLADRILEQLGKQHAEEDMKNREFILPSKHFLRNYIASFSMDPIFSRLKDIDADDIPQYLKKPLQALKDEKYESIKSICTDIIQSAELLTLPPSKIEVALLQATFDVFLGEYDTAFKLFDCILRNEDSSKNVKINVLIKRGTLHMQLDCPQKAFSDFDEAIALDQECADIYHHRGQLHLLANNTEVAKTDFDKAILYNPNFPAPYVKKYYTEYRLLHDANAEIHQIERIMKDFETCFEKFPDFTESYMLYGQIMSDIGFPQKSHEYFLKVLEKEPDNATIHVHKALVELLSTPDIDKTVASFKHAIELDPKCELAYETLGSLEVQRGNLEEAIRLFDEALRLAHTFRQLTHLHSLKAATKTQLTIKNRLKKL